MYYIDNGYVKNTEDKLMHIKLFEVNLKWEIIF